MSIDFGWRKRILRNHAYEIMWNLSQAVDIKELLASKSKTHNTSIKFDNKLINFIEQREKFLSLIFGAYLVVVVK